MSLSFVIDIELSLLTTNCGLFDLFVFGQTSQSWFRCNS